MKGIQKGILKKEGLEDWKIVYSIGGYLTVSSIKEFWLKKNTTLAMFLHEVAHAKCNKWNKKMGDKTGHHSIWGDCYTELVDKYMK